VSSSAAAMSTTTSPGSERCASLIGFMPWSTPGSRCRFTGRRQVHSTEQSRAAASSGGTDRPQRGRHPGAGAGHQARRGTPAIGQSAGGSSAWVRCRSAISRQPARSRGRNRRAQGCGVFGTRRSTARGPWPCDGASSRAVDDLARGRAPRETARAGRLRGADEIPRSRHLSGEFSERDPRSKQIAPAISTKVSVESRVGLQMGAFDRMASGQTVSLQSRSANPRFPRPGLALHSISI
jgi:hypothetical protein